MESAQALKLYFPPLSEVTTETVCKHSAKSGWDRGTQLLCSIKRKTFGNPLSRNLKKRANLCGTLYFS